MHGVDGTHGEELGRPLRLVSKPSSRVKRKREVTTIWSACCRIAALKGPKGPAARTIASARWSSRRDFDVVLRTAPLAAPGQGFDLVINASASSLQGAAVPVPRGTLAPEGLGVDLMYGPPAQGFLDWATQQGAQARDGLGMLVEQAAEAFFLWRGVRPQTTPVLQALRARLA